MSTAELKEAIKKHIDQASDDRIAEIGSELLDILDPIEPETGLRTSEIQKLIDEADESIKINGTLTHDQVFGELRRKFNLNA